MTEEHLIGGGAESFDTNGLRFQKLGSDFATGATIELPNVLFSDRKVRAIEKLISVKPETTT